MKRLGLMLGFLGLLACSDARSQAEASPKIPPMPKTNMSPTVLTNWIIDKTNSTLAFSGNQSGDAFTGEFKNFDAVINFDPQDLANANVVVTIDMNSADANDTERTEALPGKEWFYVKQFPTAKFEAAEFEHLLDDKFEAKGKLTIKDTTQIIVLPFTLKLKDGRADMNAKLTLNRNDFKIGTGMWASEDWVGHEIVIIIHLEAIQK